MRIYVVLALALGAGACSTGRHALNDIGGDNAGAPSPSSSGPTISMAKTDPGLIVLNRDCQPKQPPKIVADVKDGSSPVTDVELHFENVPLTLPMHNVGGTKWETSLNSDELEMMAVSGQTEKYSAQVIAKNADGKTSSGESPVQVAVEAPDQSLPATL